MAGASVSAGMGGSPFGEEFKKAAPTATVASEASILVFRNPRAAIREQLYAATAFRPDLVIAVDLLFWPVYGTADQAQRLQNVAEVLAQLATLLEQGAKVVVGSVPRITTASPVMLDPQAVPAEADLTTINAAIADWAAKSERSWLFPFADLAQPLVDNREVNMPDGSLIKARDLMSMDGLHPNAQGTYYTLAHLDLFLEQRGVSAPSIVFVRPKQ